MDSYIVEVKPAARKELEALPDTVRARSSGSSKLWANGQHDAKS